MTEEKTQAIVPAEANQLSADVFGTPNSIEQAKIQAKILMGSSILPDAIRGSLPNCIVVLDMARRLGIAPAMLARKIFFVHGAVGVGAEVLIASVNAARKQDGGKAWSRIKYRWEGKRGEPGWGCRAYAVDLETNEECVGSLIDMQVVKAMKWDAPRTNKDGKPAFNPWLAMPEQMMMYRAATYWVRVFAPELSMGMTTEDELAQEPQISAQVAEMSVTTDDPNSDLEREILKGGDE